MQYWLTTHWPRRADQPAQSPHEGVWVPDGKRQVIDRVKPDDLVFIYESRNGRTEIRSYADGTTRKLHRLRGREGVVALVQVVEPAYELEESHPEHYTDRTTIWWRYYAPTDSINSAGFVPRAQVAAILGYKEQYVFRGFGEGHSGLMQLTAEQFETIFRAFLAAASSSEREHVTRPFRPGHGLGGEGMEHKELKRRISEDPASVLGEPGLTFFAQEWPLATGDRIDVVLKDGFGRFIAVEVEVDCDKLELAGPLQCMKYRAMLSYVFDRPWSEVRSILAAHTVHDEVATRCRLHRIEVIQLPRLTHAHSGLP